MPSHTKVTHNDKRDTRTARPYRFKKYTNHSVRATLITLSNRHIMVIMRPPKQTVVSELQRILRSRSNICTTPTHSDLLSSALGATLIPCTTLQIYSQAPQLAQIFLGSDQSNSSRFNSILQYRNASSIRFWLHDRQRSNCWNCHVFEPNGEVDQAKSICSPWLLSVFPR